MFEQQFQMAEGICRVGDRRGVFTEVRLRGEDLSFVMEITVEGVGRTRHAFAGKVEGDEIRGTVTVTPPEGKAQQLPWVARRGSAASWFRTTGVNIK
jgi:hypothetical protein